MWLFRPITIPVLLIMLFFSMNRALATQRIEQDVTDITLGHSTAGRPITGIRIGDGSRKLVLIGDTHGGPEANTYRLIQDLIQHFRAHPEEIPPTIRLYLIPTLNPDGLVANTRFNAHGVDLNRNMNTNLDSCPENDWRTEVNGARGIISNTGGLAPETEVESRLIRDFLLDASGAIFYHSAGGEIFPPYCEHQPSLTLAQLYAQASGYIYTRYYPRYLITGGMHDWAGSMGIASFIPELWNGNDSDMVANLKAIHTVLLQAETVLPIPQDQKIRDIVVPAVFWRYWQSHGGAERFGWPLATPRQQGGREIQYFERAIFKLHPDAADTPSLVQLAPLDMQVQALLKRTSGTSQGTYSQDIAARFAEVWERGGGTTVYGAPLSSITSGISLVDGTPRLVQYFERMRLEYNPKNPTTDVQLSPLGWYVWQRRQLMSPTLAQQIR